jgi:hypothetical protein
MNRREYLSLLGTGAVVTTAGCSGAGGNVEGDIVVDETVTEGDIRRFNFEVEQGETINVYINNIEGARTTVVLTNPDGDTVGEYEAETENTASHDAQMSGAYAANITTLGEAEIEIGLE